MERRREKDKCQTRQAQATLSSRDGHPYNVAKKSLREMIDSDPPPPAEFVQAAGEPVNIMEERPYKVT